MTQLYKIDELVISTQRQRSDFELGLLNELADSISTNGLLHPVVVRVAGSDVHLVAGERRIRAILDLNALDRQFKFNNQLVDKGYVPGATLGELTPIEAMEAELEENVRRINLSWQDEARATLKLRELRTLQARAAGLPAPMTIAIAPERYPEVGQSAALSKVKDELNVVRFLDDPDIGGAKSLIEAVKVMDKKEDIRQRQALAARVGTVYSTKQQLLFNEDMTEWLPKCPSNQFDVILTDPPYGISSDEFGTSGGRAEAHTYEDSPERAATLYNVLAQESFRVTKPDAHIYVFCDIDLFASLRLLFSKFNWRVHRTPLIWYKPSGMRAPWPEMGPQRKWQMILYAVKGQRPTNHLAGDVITANPDDNMGHQAQKPIAVISDLLGRSAHPGDRVLDPFCGTGTIFAAAHAMNCYATGIELDPAHYGLALRRLETLK